jgi:hypothetical protein
MGLSNHSVFVGFLDVAFEFRHALRQAAELERDLEHRDDAADQHGHKRDADADKGNPLVEAQERRSFTTG